MPAQSLHDLKQELLRRGALEALAVLESMSQAVSPLRSTRSTPPKLSPFATRLLDGKPLSPLDIVRSVESGDALSPQLLKLLSARATLSPLHSAAASPPPPSPPPQVAIRYPETLAEEIEAQKVELRRACAEMILLGDLERARALLSNIETVDSWAGFNAHWAESERSARIAGLEHALEVQRGELEALHGALLRQQPEVEKTQPRFELGGAVVSSTGTCSSPAGTTPKSAPSGRSSTQQVTALSAMAAAAVAGVGGAVPPSSVVVSVNSPFPPPLYLQDPLPPPPSSAFVSNMPSFEAPPSLETTTSRDGEIFNSNSSGRSATPHKPSFWDPPPDTFRSGSSGGSSSSRGMRVALEPIPPFRGGSARNAVEPEVGRGEVRQKAGKEEGEEEEKGARDGAPPPKAKKPGYFEQLFDQLFKDWSCYPSVPHGEGGRRM